MLVWARKWAAAEPQEDPFFHPRGELGGPVEKQTLRKRHSMFLQDNMWGEGPADAQAETRSPGTGVPTVRKEHVRTHQPAVLPGLLTYERPSWLARFLFNAASEKEGTDTTQHRYGDLQARYCRSRQLEINVVEASNMPSFDLKAAFKVFVTVSYGEQSDSTKPVNSSTNPAWNHFIVFKYFPHRVILQAQVFACHGQKGISEIGFMRLVLRTHMESDDDMEIEASVYQENGSEVLGDNSKPCSVLFRVRVTEKTYNDSLPPYRFPRALFVRQKEIEDDGPPPRQLAHLTGWAIPNIQDSLAASEGEGALVQQKVELATGYNKELKDRRTRLVKSNFKGVKLTVRERIVALTSNIWFQLGIMLVVLIDMAAILIFAFMDSGQKDCFSRDLPAELSISFSVIVVLTMEVCLRIFGHGSAFFSAFFSSNTFDLCVVTLSLFIALLQLMMDLRVDVSVCKRYGQDVYQQCKYPNILQQSSDACKDMLDKRLIDNDSSTSGLGWIGSSPRALRQVAILVRLARVLAGLLRAWRMRGNVEEKIRQTVAAKKRRYQINGFDIDLTYITDKCLAMSTPGFVAHRGYRNDMQEVSRFFNMFHYGSHRIYNLCEEFEGNYHPAMLYFQMRRYPFDDHNAPTLKQILAFCQNALDFISGDPENVIAVHCKGGKGRTGVMVCCWLLYSGHRATALDALELFAFRRSVFYYMGNHDNQTAEAPSQVRYVHYLEAVLYHNLNPASEPVKLLSAIALTNCPDGVYLSVSVFSRGVLVYDSRCSSRELQQTKAGKDLVWNLPITEVRGDVKIEVFRHEGKASSSARLGSKKYDSKVEKWPWCQVVFHTMPHVEEKVQRYSKMQIDYCHKDRKHHKFGADFGLSLHFVQPEDRGGFALSLNHAGTLQRSAFGSLDPSVKYGGLRIHVLRVDGLRTPPAEGSAVEIEIEGCEVRTDFTPKDDLAQTREWHESLALVLSSPSLSARITLVDKREKVNIAVASGALVVNEEDMEALAAKEHQNMLQGIDVTSRSSSADLATGLRVIQLTATEAVSAGPVKKAEGSAGCALTVALQYEAWDLPKEYWDRQTFGLMIQQLGRIETVREGQEIIAPGSNQRLIYLVLKGVVNAQVTRIDTLDSHIEPIVVEMFGENDLFGAMSFLCGHPEMQHVAFTDATLAVVDASVLVRESLLVEKLPADSKLTHLPQNKHDYNMGLRVVDKLLFFKILALCLSERLVVMRQHVIQFAGRDMQSDGVEALKEEQLKAQLRLMCIEKFSLRCTEQCLYIGHAVKIWKTLESVSLSDVKHWRCRMIFLSSCVVLEPTLEGTLFLDATYRDHVIDASRIISVRDDGPGRLVCTYTDFQAAHENLRLAMGRHPVLELRIEFPNAHTAHYCEQHLRTMARTAFQSRCGEKMVKTIFSDSTIPCIETLLHKALLAGLLSSYEADQSFGDMVGVGDIVYVVRGAVSVKSLDSTPFTLWTLRAGEIYGDHLFLSNGKRSNEALYGGASGCQVLILQKDYLVQELLADLPFAVRFYRDLATVLAHRLNAELLFAYGTYWRTS